MATTNLPAAVATAAHNANNQLTSWAGATLTYDLNGNLTGDGTNTYTWNARDQLASLSGGSSASFVYDGVGRRRSKTIGSMQTGFLYDGVNFVQELTGSTVNANLITGGIDEVLLRKEGSTARHFMSDALGSVIALTDAAGAVQTQYSFEPYGKTTVTGSANSNSQRFTGREEDSTGIYYYRARYFSPQLSRFIAEDPIGWQSGQTNDYQYVWANPVSFVDPLGHWGLHLGGSASYVPGVGGSVGGGRYFTGDTNQTGSYLSRGTEYGLGWSAGITLGWFRGYGKDLFCGDGNSTNVSVGFATFTISYANNQFSGLSLTIGPGLRYGFTANSTNTGDYPDN